MRLLSFLTRKPVAVRTAQEADVLRRQIAATRALNDDLAADLERLIRRVDLLSWQVRDLDAREKGRAATEFEAFFIGDRAGPRP
ncbi:hypothetical protein [Albirhodobacter sp. R86504]|uniref:hypothetical protein n=1 Tax=Albirhodobacter sp. R86504 TaxID=3093848 RepID=UPI00366E140F